MHCCTVLVFLNNIANQKHLIHTHAVFGPSKTPHNPRPFHFTDMMNALTNSVGSADPTDEQHADLTDPGFDVEPRPVFNENTVLNQSAEEMLKNTLTFVWTIGPYCELPINEQLEILQEAVRYLGKSCPEARVQLHTFSRHRSSLIYQDNPVFVVM